MRRSRSRTCDGTALTDWDTDAIKPALLLTHTESQDTHDFFNDASADEVAASSAYTAGCVTLGSKTATYDTASDQTRLDAASTSSTISATEAVVCKSTGTASTSPLIGYIDLGGVVSTTDGTFQITWDASGVPVLEVT